MKKIKQYLALFGAITLLAGIATQVIPARSVSAAQITSRSLTLQAGSGGDGGSKPGGTVNHSFSFTLPTTGTGSDVGSIKFQYCTTAAAVPLGINCNAPTGVDVNTVALGNQTGATGFTGMTRTSEDDAADGVKNEVIISRAAAATIAASPNNAVTYRLDNVVNPTSAMTFFVRISTYATLDGSGTAIDTGTVAAATSTQIHIDGTMPESLVFCAGKTVSLTNSVPDCSTVTTGNISFDRLFSPTDTAVTTSQMAASTNATTGYAITVNGPTLTSGSNTITAMSSTDKSKFGVSQFGLNVVLNDGSTADGGPDMTTMPTGYAASANVAPASNGTNYNGTPAGASAPTTDYHTNGRFTFNNNNTVATSNSLGTDAQIYTASYIVNVPGSQPAGTYSSTLTYICTATF